MTGEFLSLASGGRTFPTEGSNFLKSDLHQLILDPTLRRLILLSLGTGFAAASIMPVMSTHLAINLYIEPVWIGLFFACNTFSGVAVSHWLAKRSDAGLSRVRIIRVSVTLSLVAAIGLGLAHQYFLLLIAGVVMSGAMSPVQPQLFALAREQVKDDQVTLFQSFLRATVSLSWIIGPPLAYILFERIGFLGLSLCCAAIFFLTRLNLSHLMDTPLSLREPGTGSDDGRIKWAMLSMGAVFAANSMYTVYMPIYVRETLQMGAVVPGFLMGTAAGLEIPLMIGAGVYANRWQLFSPLKVASLCGLIFFLCFFLFTHKAVLFIAQVLNAAFIGIMAGLGISVFQMLMQGRRGMASTLYTNAIKIGSFVGVLTGGVIAQWVGFRSIFLACSGMAALSLGALFMASRQRGS